MMLAHAVRIGSHRLPKGRVLTGEDIDRLSAEGMTFVTAVRLDVGDIGEDDAAARLAASIPTDHLSFSPASTGRVNVYASVDGLFCVDKSAVDAFNRIDPAITLACLADRVPVRTGDMVATIKIIPLAVAGEALQRGCHCLDGGRPFEVRPFISHAVTLIATELPSLKTSVMDRTARLLAQRVAISGSRLINENRVSHARNPLEAALLQEVDRVKSEPAIIVVFGASAVTDVEDVIPSAIRAVGGEVLRVGMPVDPGNLLVLGRIDGIPVVGAPGCARSPKENGFDWVLNRLMAGESPEAIDIAGMGVGGLLMEISTRPAPREGARPTPDKGTSGGLVVGGLLMAAGQARRMGDGGPHKLLAEFDGEPLVRRSAETLLASRAKPIVAVTGHRGDEIRAALVGLDLECRDNPDYATGLASSLVTGLSAPDLEAVDGVLVMLADMPAVTAPDIDALLAAFETAGGGVVVRSVSNGKRGNPIILPRETFVEVKKLRGDVGARALIEEGGLPIIDVEIGPAAHLDVDTPEAVVAAGGILRT